MKSNSIIPHVMMKMSTHVKYSNQFCYELKILTDNINSPPSETMDMTKPLIKDHVAEHDQLGHCLHHIIAKNSSCSKYRYLPKTRKH